MPCAREIVLAESDAAIADKGLKIKSRKLTLDSVRQLLSPASLEKRSRHLAPNFLNLLDVFADTPNEYQRKKVRKQARKAEKKERDAAALAALGMTEIGNEEEAEKDENEEDDNGVTSEEDASDDEGNGSAGLEGDGEPSLPRGTVVRLPKFFLPDLTLSYYRFFCSQYRSCSLSVTAPSIYCQWQWACFS